MSNEYISTEKISKARVALIRGGGEIKSDPCLTTDIMFRSRIISINIILGRCPLLVEGFPSAKTLNDTLIKFLID